MHKKLFYIFQTQYKLLTVVETKNFYCSSHPYNTRKIRTFFPVFIYCANKEENFCEEHHGVKECSLITALQSVLLCFYDLK